ncbi:ABC transporter substrate-binding protein [Nocardiopsis metallicus]|uniref:Iron complex transport system substrate-binding protein n=1 Tax=Nocardiopsis metallicus TaxID=179819 RepID=A0A840W070_9ACTN|nr:ABC transporter substrate-binding protein [Nocardiopsis metallicus]MBB5490180.1 iron complex transport system substrate-binding protein [Nocardiopsis metallicus]
MPEFIRSARSLSVFALAGALALSACGTDGGAESGGSASEEGAQTRTVEGANGSVEVPASPERIAVLWRPTLAAVTQLGHDVVGTMGSPGEADQGLAPFLPEGVDGADLTLVTSSPAEDDINIEELANTEPDLIIGVSTAVGAQTELLDSLEAIAPTVLLEWEGTGSWRGHLEEVAELLDAQAEAEEEVAAYDAAVEQARTDLAEADVDPARTELSLVRLQSESEIRLETPASFPGQIVDDLGFARPDTQVEADGDTDFIPHSYENLDQADGDAVFVLAGSGYPDAPDTFSEGLWSNLGAVQDERLYRMDYDFWGSANYHGAHRIIEDVTAALTGETAPAV